MSVYVLECKRGLFILSYYIPCLSLFNIPTEFNFTHTISSHFLINLSNILVEIVIINLRILIFLLFKIKIFYTNYLTYTKTYMGCL